MITKFHHAFFALIFFSINTFSQPISTFTISKHKICSGNSCSFTNFSTGANKYEWFVDGIHYSDATDTTFQLIENCYIVLPVKLIATDTLSGLTDFDTEFIEIFDSCYFHLTGDFLRCPGDTVSLSRHPDAIACFWDLGIAAIASGCDTCASVSFIIPQGGLSVDLHQTYSGNCTDIVSYHYICGSIGIEELQNDFRIFPNPFSGFINIQSRNADIERVLIYNDLGSLVHDEQYENSILNLSRFVPGIYLIKLQYRHALSKVVRIVKVK